MNKRTLSVDGIAYFLISIGLFYFLLLFTAFEYYPITDIKVHAIAILKINYGLMSYPPHFIYYLIVNIFSLFSQDLYIIYISSSFVLSLAAVFKYELTKKIMMASLSLKFKTNTQKKYLAVLITVSFCLMFFFAIQDYFGAFMFNRYYYGKVVPNVWNNSTTILLFPFSIMLFWKQYKILTSDGNNHAKNIFPMSLLVVTNILIKPSFFLAYAPVTLFFLFLRFRISKAFILNVVHILAGMFLMYFMHKMIFVMGIGDLNENAGSVEFSKPFDVWTYYIPGWYLPISFLHSLAFPIMFFVFYRKKAFKSFMIRYSSSLMIFALLVSIIIVEEGPRKYHGNFMWQNVVCSYILMLSVTIEALKIFFKEGFRSLKIKILTIVFFLHTVSGFIYLIRLFVFKRVS